MVRKLLTLLLGPFHIRAEDSVLAVYAVVPVVRKLLTSVLGPFYIRAYSRCENRVRTARHVSLDAADCSRVRSSKPHGNSSNHVERIGRRRAASSAAAAAAGREKARKVGKEGGVVVAVGKRTNKGQ